MIRSKRQLNVTEQRLAQFDATIAAFNADQPPPDVQPGAHRAAFEALVEQRRELHAEILQYHRLLSDGVSAIEIKTVGDIPTALIQARIARKLTQAQLADQLGVKQQQLQRWERDDYETASFATILEVACALGVEQLLVDSRRDPAQRPGAFLSVLFSSRSRRAGAPTLPQSLPIAPFPWRTLSGVSLADNRVFGAAVETALQTPALQTFSVMSPSITDASSQDYLLDYLTTQTPPPSTAKPVFEEPKRSDSRDQEIERLNQRVDRLEDLLAEQLARQNIWQDQNSIVSAGVAPQPALSPTLNPDSKVRS